MDSIMNKYLFVTIPEKGHINPMIGTAQFLQQLGHKVFFSSPADIGQYLNKFELQFVPNLVTSSPSRPTCGAELVELVQDKEMLSDWVTSLLCNGLEDAIPAYQQCYNEINPDCVVIDPLMYAPALAAHINSTPWVALSNSMNPVLPSSLTSDLLSTSKKIDKFRYDLIEKHKLKTSFRGCDILSPHLNIVFTTPSVSGYNKHDVQQVGPTFPYPESIKKFERRYPERPMIYISFGSQVYYWPDFFERAVNACENLGAELVLSVGDLADTSYFQDLPSWVHSYRYAPQVSVLKQADLFVTHGGANSFMEAVYFGVPMIINPICNDQFHQSYFVRKNQLGTEKQVTEMSTNDLSSLFTQCLHSNEWCSGLKKAHESYQINGSLLAAQRIEDLC